MKEVQGAMQALPVLVLWIQCQADGKAQLDEATKATPDNNEKFIDAAYKFLTTTERLAKEALSIVAGGGDAAAEPNLFRDRFTLFKAR
eukprot:12249194-Alexandrium_andersonii.AAC.1